MILVPKEIICKCARDAQGNTNYFNHDPPFLSWDSKHKKQLW